MDAKIHIETTVRKLILERVAIRNRIKEIGERDRQIDRELYEVAAAARLFGIDQ